MKIFLSSMRLIQKIIILISIILLVSSCSLNKGIGEEQSTPITRETRVETFQEYLWYQNPVVLMLHIAIMLAGAIAVTALLPAPYEEEIKE